MLTVLTKPNKRKATAKDTSSETNQNLSIETRGIHLNRIASIIIVCAFNCFISMWEMQHQM